MLVGSEIGFPPYADVDSQGQPIGFSVELFSAVARAMGIQVQYRADRWENVWRDLQQGELDALPLVAKLKEREGLLEYTSAHTIGYDAFFVRRSERHIASIDEARPLTIVAMRSDAAADALLARGFGDRLVLVETLADAFRLLASGKHDAVAAPLLQGRMIVQSLGLGNVVEAGKPLPEYRREFAFAVQRGNTALRDRLDQGLAIVKATGEYERIYRKWLGAYQPASLPWEYVYWGSGATVAVLALLGLWTWMLRRQVRLRTQALADEIDRRKAIERELEQHRDHLEQLVASRTAELQAARLAAEHAADEARRGQARYQALFDNMLDGYAHHAMVYEDDRPVDFVFIDTNPAFEQLTGLRNVAGKKVSELISGIPESNPELFERFGRVAMGGPPERFESFIAALGRWFSFAVYSPQQGQFITVFSNVTERKQAEETLARHRLQLEAEVAARTADLVEINKELQGFTYAASHDMKGPLGRINAFSQMLERHYRDRLDGEGIQFIGFIRSNAVRLMTLLDDLLEHARIEQTTMDLQPIDLQQAVRAALSFSAEEIRQVGADVRIDVPPIAVRATDHGLAQVLRNLLDNAVKYSRQAMPPIIEIGAYFEDGHCRLWVRDNGIGFDMAYRDTIFEIFRRLHTYDEFQGSGVGLALVRKALERMGGRVWAQSEPGGGATFYIELPAETQPA